MKVIIVTISLFIFLARTAHAAPGFTVSPAVIEINKSGNHTIKLTNRSLDPVTLTYRFISLTVSGEGSVRPGKELQPPQGISIEGIEQNNQISMPPGSEHEVSLVYNPSNQDSLPLMGVEFTSVSIDTPENRTASNVQTSIVVPMILTGSNSVPKSDDIQFSAPLLIFNNLAEFDIKASNTGKNPIKIEGDLRIKNLLGETVEVYNLEPRYIFADQVRNFTYSNGEKIAWDPEILIGIYRAEITMKYGDATIVKNQVLLGIPGKPTVVLLIVAIFMSGVYLRVRKYRH